jgi:HEXXH motif-containing protein
MDIDCSKFTAFQWSAETLLGLQSRLPDCERRQKPISNECRLALERAHAVSFSSMASHHVVVDAALALLSNILPEARYTVETFALNKHILEFNDPDTDVSFSVPELPTHIFFSVPPAEVAEVDRVARVAEAIFHEALHLQLAVVESVSPDAFSSVTEPQHYSPWKRELRPLGGMLHAIYVFGHIHMFWVRALLMQLPPRLHIIADRRCREIAVEARAVGADLPFSAVERQLVDPLLRAFPT